MSKDADSKWIIVGIALHEKSMHFIHFILGSYTSKGEADKDFRIKMEFSDFWSDGYNSVYNPLVY